MPPISNDMDFAGRSEIGKNYLVFMTLELILSSFCLLLVLMVKHNSKKLRTATKKDHKYHGIPGKPIKSINLYTCNNGAPCTRICLHFIHNFVTDLQIFSLQQFWKYNLHLNQIWQFMIFILQLVRKLSSSHLHSSPEGKRNLHLRLQTEVAFFKSSCKPAGSPNNSSFCLIHVLETMG